MARTHSQPRPHALAQALPRSAGFALLRPVARPELDGQRIVTLSGAIAINLLAMGLLMMPLAMPPPATWEPPATRHPIRDIERVKPVEVEIVRKKTEPAANPTPAQPPTVAPRPAESPSSAVVVETGTEQVLDPITSDDAGPTMDLGNAVPSGPAAVQLEYLSAPAPKYPRGAQQRRIEGTVMLQVLVGIDGRPLDVTVTQSSGNRELDEAARTQILKRWSFQPAMRNGQPVQAIGLVPIEFALRN